MKSDVYVLWVRKRPAKCCRYLTIVLINYSFRPKMDSLNISDGVALDTGYNGKSIGDERACTQAASRSGGTQSSVSVLSPLWCSSIGESAPCLGRWGIQGSLPDYLMRLVRRYPGSNPGATISVAVSVRKAVAMTLTAIAVRRSLPLTLPPSHAPFC